MPTRRLSRVSLAIVLVAGAVLSSTSPAWACACAGGASLAFSVRASGVVFVADVTRLEILSRPPRVLPSGAVERGGADSEIVHLTVNQIYKGEVPKAVAIRRSSGSDCEVGFRQAETWLIYGTLDAGSVRTDKCSRTRLLARARQDVVYLEALAEGRPQGVVYGELLRRGLWQGRLQLMAPERSAPLIVVGLSGGRRIEADAEWGSYQLVLSPGPAQLWVELDGHPVMKPLSVEVTDRGEHRVMPVVEYPD
jgi:hypothetical protein